MDYCYQHVIFHHDQVLISAFALHGCLERKCRGQILTREESRERGFIRPDSFENQAESLVFIFFSLHVAHDHLGTHFWLLLPPYPHLFVFEVTEVRQRIPINFASLVLKCSNYIHIWILWHFSILKSENNWYGWMKQPFPDMPKAPIPPTLVGGSDTLGSPRKRSGHKLAIGTFGYLPAY